MVMLSFRNMTEQDLPCVSKIEHSAGPHPWRLNHFIDSLKSGHCCKVALWKNDVIGQAVLMIVADEAHLLILSVDKAYQGKGVGRALLQQLVEEAEQQKVKTVFLEVRASNDVAFALYMNYGFNEVGRRANYYPCVVHGSEDAIVMAMEI